MMGTGVTSERRAARTQCAPDIDEWPPSWNLLKVPSPKWTLLGKVVGADGTGDDKQAEGVTTSNDAASAALSAALAAVRPPLRRHALGRNGTHDLVGGRKSGYEA